MSTFSKQIIDKFASFDHVEVIATLLTASVNCLAEVIALCSYTC